MPSTVPDPDVTLAGLTTEIATMRAEVSSLRDMLDQLAFEPKSEDDAGAVGFEIRREVARMVREISRVKAELASIKHPETPDDMIDSANRHLETIIQSTEDATTSIMESADGIEAQIKAVRMRAPEDAGLNDVLEGLSGRLITIIEACAFQDLTGQRIVKVIQTLRFLEQRLLGVIDIWGIEAFRHIPLDRVDTAEPDAEAGELLDGPALSGEGLTQDDIDALFD